VGVLFLVLIFLLRFFFFFWGGGGGGGHGGHIRPQAIELRHFKLSIRISVLKI
jgi:hypothetical protein